VVAPSAGGDASVGSAEADDAIVGRSGAHQVSLADYGEALRRMSLTAPETRLEAGRLPRSLLVAPAFRQTTVQELLDIRVARQRASELNIVVSPAAVDAYIPTDPQLNALAGDPEVLSDRLRARDLTMDDFRAIAAERAMAQLVGEALVPPFDDEELWAAFQKERNKIVLRFLAIPNTATSEEISEGVITEWAEIERVYATRPDRFRIPASRRVRMLEVATAPNGADAAREKLEQARLQIMAGGDFGALAAKISDHPTASKGGALGYVVRPQLPEAFSQPVGVVSEVCTGPTGVFIVIAEEELPAHTRPLSDGVKREIAARLLRDRAPTTRARTLADQLIALWSEPSGDPTHAKESVLLSRDLLKVERTLPFSPSPGGEGFVGGIGRAPEIVKIASTMTVSGAVHATPVLFGGKLYVLALDSRTTATRAQFGAEREAFTRQHRAHRVRNAIPDLAQQYRTQHPPSFDMAPIVAKYGEAASK
jgi:hypothetical protein